MSWPDVSLDPNARASSARRLDADGTPVVNPPTDEGRLELDYAGYVGLDALLSAGVPASTVPDERAFLATHQLCEVAFRLMVFDLGVLSRTMQALLEADDATFEKRIAATLPTSDRNSPLPFWRPALTAAARLRHTAKRILPAVMVLLGVGDDEDVLFSTIEFNRFRDFLVPSSGFQTAQLRLIQRALAKGPLLDVPIFPGDTLSRNYTGCPVGHVPLTDEVILHSQHQVATPDKGTFDHEVTQLDERIHAVLARVGENREQPNSTGIPLIEDAQVNRLVSRFRSTLGDGEEAEDATETLLDNMKHLAEHENERRKELERARTGAFSIHAISRNCLGFVIDRVVETDRALHDPETASFLTVHRKTVRRHIAGDSGTGGGGMPYLVTSQRYLFPFLPAAIAYADLVGAPGSADRDLW